MSHITQQYFSYKSSLKIFKKLYFYLFSCLKNIGLYLNYKNNKTDNFVLAENKTNNNLFYIIILLSFSTKYISISHL